MKKFIYWLKLKSLFTNKIVTSTLVVSSIFFFKNKIFAQATITKAGLPNIFPVSPKSQEFMKYTEIPVGKYTGVPSISIPIYKIQTNGIEVPINLSYHSNGFKVNEEAGWTGLGWTLNAGGSIVQVVNEFDDFGYYRCRNDIMEDFITSNNYQAQAAINKSNGIPLFFTYTSDGRTTENIFGSSFGIISGGHNFNGDGLSLPKQLGGTLDSKPDLFKFNMLDYNGEFVLDWQNNSFVCINDPNYKISCNSNLNANGWTIAPTSIKITAPDGNIFTFNLKEETIISGVANYSLLPPRYLDELVGSKSSRCYQLVKINTSKGGIINFNYTQSNLLENLPSICHTIQFNKPGSPLAYYNLNYKPASDFSTSINYSKQSYSYLTSIDFELGKLVFESDDNRTDYVGTKKLNKIKLFDNFNNIIKFYELNYDYFEGVNFGNNTDTYLSSTSISYTCNKTPDELLKRLKLVSLIEKSTFPYNNVQPPYIFEYDNEPLPSKTSTSVDFWGFYNKKINSSKLIPNLTMLGLYDPNLVGIGNNLNADLTGSKACVLTKIKYPTGGYSEFDYELNTFENFRVPDDEHSYVETGRLSDENLSTDNTTKVFYSDVQSLIYGKSTYSILLSTVGPMSATTNTFSTYIRLTVLKKTAANLAFVNSSNFSATYNNTVLGAVANPSKELSTYVSNIVSDGRFFGLDYDATIYSYPTQLNRDNFKIHIDQENIYILQAYLDPSSGPQGTSTKHAYAIINFNFLKNIKQEVSYGAGLRVKTIKTYDDLRTTLIKKFNYLSGKLMSPLQYLKNTSTDFLDDGNNTFFSSTISSSSFIPISFNASGKTVGYDQVEEISLSKNNEKNGKIIERYYNTPDRGAFFPTISVDPSFNSGSSQYIPFANCYDALSYEAPLRKSKIKNGLVTQSYIYDNNDNLLKSTDNNWKMLLPSKYFYSCVRNLCFEQHTIIPGGGGEKKGELYLTGYYSITPYNTVLDSSVTSDYDKGKRVNTIKKYEYDNNGSLINLIERNSKNKIIQTRYTRIYDYPYYYSSLISKNILTPIVEIIKDDITGTPFTLEKTKQIYQDLSGTSTDLFSYGLYLQQSSLKNNPLVNDITYDIYGDYSTPSKFKLQQYHDRSGINTSILWGYNGQYPVAKILGSDYATASALVNQTVLDNITGSYSEAALKTELAKLRTLPNAFVTTYTYKPLVGIASETDPQGKTITYEYDIFNRLKLIRDNDNNILSRPSKTV